MSRTGLAVVIAIAVVTALSGCGRKLPVGVLEGGAHVPPPPSEAHRVTSRVASPPAEAQANQSSSATRLQKPAR